MIKKRLLLFAYFYPPLGGPAVQRPLKMIKYLAEMNWKVEVITVKDIVYHSRDETLLQEDRAEKVYPTGSADVMSLLKKVSDKSCLDSAKIYFKTPEFVKKIIRSGFIIDDKYGWLKFALQQAEELCKKRSYDAVMATISPYTPALAAYKISQEFNLPLIIDYRDHWTLNPFKHFLTPLHKIISRKWEIRILRRSSLISVAGRIMGQELVEEFGKCLKTKIQVMYNGWDKEDFDQVERRKNPENKFIMSYIGSLYGEQKVKYFIQALQQLKGEDKIPSDLEVRFVGNFYRENLDQISCDELGDIIRIIPQVEHLKALELMFESDVLLLFFPGNIYRSVVMGKVFEYLYSGGQIFAMIPGENETADLIREHGQEHICPMEDIAAIKEHLEKIFQGGPKQTTLIQEKYSRRNQVQQFGNRLNEII
ncbi:MAG: hypothetical protein APR54_06835 [Candidatus Cloacimonas sp. SDB]|nr:MAG: hypothetical protein APR54_06835 [Candidatus Cloacimonas sp. SDB]